MTEERVRIVIQKSGRLTEKSLSLISCCGLNVEWSREKLFCNCENFPVDLMLMRDDDIPEYVLDGVCDLGIVGLNILQEKLLSRNGNGSTQGVEVLRKLDFGHCRLSIAVPKNSTWKSILDMEGTRIATSYPASVRQFLKQKGINAKIVEISGSVEIAPTLNVADAICDLVSTGATLKSNGLKEIETVLESQSVLVKRGVPLGEEKENAISRLIQRVDGVQEASKSKYIMMNAPREALDTIKAILPGMENPSVIPIGNDNKKIAIHSVAKENIFWETMEKLKKAGASSILVVPIEKIIR